MRRKIISLITLTAIEVDGVLNSGVQLIPFQTIQKMVTLSVELSIIIISSSLIVDVGAHSLRLLRQFLMKPRVQTQKEQTDTTQPTKQENKQEQQQKEQAQQRKPTDIIDEIIRGK